MKQTFWALMMIGSLLMACTKENDNGGGNSSTYQPTKAGSQWTYKNDNLLPGGSSSTYVLTATSKDTMAAGQSWRVFSNGSGSEYYRQAGSDYFQYGRFEGLGNPVELPYLKAGANVGASWNLPVPLTVSGVTITVDAKFTIAQKGVGHTVAGKAYTNVIVVDVLLAPPAIAPIVSQKIRYYYAENVGRIQADVQVNAPIANINVNNVTTLQSFSIVP